MAIAETSLTAETPMPAPLARSGRWRATVKVWLIVGFFALHVPLALGMKSFKPLSTAHALAAVALGLGVAVFSRQLAHAAYVAAYVVGSEALWRMTKAEVFWEFGKYATVAVLLAAVVRQGRLRGWGQPALYFALLLPAAMIPLTAENLSAAREMISFNLSGPLALTACVLYFRQLKITREQLITLCSAYLAPVIGMVTVILFKMKGVELTFGGQSNTQTSGGFGPNQVSAALGLACLIAFLVVVDRAVRWELRTLLFAGLLLFAAQSALTFSRCGLYYAGASILAAAVCLVRNPRQALQLAGVAGAVVAIFYFLIFPQLDAFTGGALSARFQKTQLTGRDEIMMADVKLMMESPILGLGVGMADEAREKYYDSIAAAHTEFTRLLAEHGLAGVAALILLFLMAATSFRQARTVRGRALAAGMAAYSFCFMTGNGMRMALPGFVFGLAAATLLPPAPPAPQPGEAADQPPVDSAPATPGAPPA
jgi:hypothetical protein